MGSEQFEGVLPETAAPDYFAARGFQTFFFGFVNKKMMNIFNKIRALFRRREPEPKRPQATYSATYRQTPPEPFNHMKEETSPRLKDGEWQSIGRINL